MGPCPNCNGAGCDVDLGDIDAEIRAQMKALGGLMAELKDELGAAKTQSAALAGRLQKAMRERDEARFELSESAPMIAFQRLKASEEGYKAKLAKAVVALDNAIGSVEFWAAYVSDYFKDKYGFKEDLGALRAVLAELKGDSNAE
jgi:hypothetical protein